MDCDLFFSASELERDSVQSWQKKFLNQVFILNRIVHVWSIAPIPFHLSLASWSLYDHKQEKVRGIQSA